MANTKEPAAAYRYQIQRAPLPSRIIAYLIDGFLFGLLNPLFYSAVSMLFGIPNTPPPASSGPSFSTTITNAIGAGPQSAAAIQGFENMISMGSGGNYWVALGCSFAASAVLAYFMPGKTAMELRVVDSYGREVPLEKRFLRNVIKTFLGIVFLLDLVLVTCVGDKTVADYLLGTQVIYAPSG